MDDKKDKEDVENIEEKIVLLNSQLDALTEMLNKITDKMEFLEKSTDDVCREILKEFEQFRNDLTNGKR